MQLYLLIYVGNYSANAGKSIWFLWINGLQYQLTQILSQKGKSLQKKLIALTPQTKKFIHWEHEGKNEW